MANPHQQENMLLTEHFSWPPISLIDDIINTINEVLYRCTDTFDTGISSAPPHLLGFADRYAAEGRTPSLSSAGEPEYPEATLEIEEGVLKLETLMENAVDKNFDKLEIWTLRNVLCLPRGEEELARWMRLGHYEGVETGREGAGEWTPEKLYTLRRKLVETRKLNAALLAEKTRNEAQLANLRALLQPRIKTETTPTPQNPPAFAFLTHTPAAQALGIQPLPHPSSTSNPQPPTPLATHTSFTTSQLPYLRQLLANLRPHLATTSLPTTRTSSDERKVYLESQSRRILERRGVDTREGVEGAGEGGRVRGDEIAGLEGLVEVLGGRRRGDGKMVGKEEEGEGDGMDMS